MDVEFEYSVVALLKKIGRYDLAKEREDYIKYALETETVRKRIDEKLAAKQKPSSDDIYLHLFRSSVESKMRKKHRDELLKEYIT